MLVIRHLTGRPGARCHSRDKAPSERLPKLSYMVRAMARPTAALSSTVGAENGWRTSPSGPRPWRPTPAQVLPVGFESVWKEAQELGVQVPPEIIMAASTFVQRPKLSTRHRIT